RRAGPDQRGRSRAAARLGRGPRPPGAALPRPPAGDPLRRTPLPSAPDGMNPRRFGLSTTAIHGVPHRRADWAPVAPALMQSSTFVNPVGSDDEVLYSRYGNNP